MKAEKTEQLKEDMAVIECAIDNMVINCLKYIQTYINFNICNISAFNEIYKTMQNTNFAIGEMLSLKYRLEGKLQEGENK